ncbi:hypothetical protein JCGZ_12278 [Jatropha curcas]|uniref:Uncharacterized protein n=2 Tax=Jatropha curcas TaxID=180498 RepID=A0A067K6U0_JATCU|nr:hypothetical protein JCGZ_12278 [Jatropha curcas]
MGLKWVASNFIYNTEELRSSKAETTFQWGGTISALFLLILIRTGQRSALQTTLLVLYLFTSFPTTMFKILRGQFGYWIAFLAVAANLFFPETFPVSRFILFVITPNGLANGLRDTIVGGVFCLILAVSLVITELRGIGGFRNCECNYQCFFYCLGIALLFFFSILYLCSGTW